MIGMCFGQLSSTWKPAVPVSQAGELRFAGGCEAQSRFVGALVKGDLPDTSDLSRLARLLVLGGMLKLA